MINELINNKHITVYLQPIVSIKDKKIFAYEALTRATDRYSEAISPLYLFEQAKKERVSCELDDYVRELALAIFQKYYYEDESLFLFLKFDESTIEQEIVNDFLPTIYKYNIPTKNIVVEVKEDRIKNTHALKSFIDNYKKYGCLIAIDDFGIGYSSFDRLSLIEPDIVKIDRSIIYNIHNNFINSEVLSAISNMCNKIGAVVLAEGVEDRDEVLSCMDRDINIFQGFWFAKAQEEINNQVAEDIKKSIQYVGSTYKTIINENINQKKILLIEAQRLAKEVNNILNKEKIENMQKVDEIITKNSKLQAIYIIDEENGLQVGETVIHSEKKRLFNATKEGHDHSIRKYFFITKDSSKGNYLSAKYISRASGNMCKTYASKITLNDINYVLCLDILDA